METSWTNNGIPFTNIPPGTPWPFPGAAHAAFAAGSGLLPEGGVPASGPHGAPFFVPYGYQHPYTPLAAAPGLAWPLHPPPPQERLHSSDPANPQLLFGPGAASAAPSHGSFNAQTRDVPPPQHQQVALGAVVAQARQQAGKWRENVHQLAGAALTALQAAFPILPHPARLLLLHALLQAKLVTRAHGQNGAIVMNGKGRYAVSVLQGMIDPAGRGALVAACQAVLRSHKFKYLAGEQMCCYPPLRSVPNRHLVNGMSSTEVALAVQEVLLLGPDAERPELEADGMPPGSSLSLQQGPPPPPPGTRAPPPPPLQRFMQSGVPVQLMASALRKLETACRLVTVGHSCAGASGQHGLPGLHLSPDVDFGVQPIVEVPADELRGLGGSVAAGGSPLDLLHLSGSLPSVRGDDLGGSRVRSALRFQHLSLHNSAEAPIWVLGGTAAPSFPHTFAAVDDGRLFWADAGHTAVQLGRGQQHSVSVAMCPVGGPHRKQEQGILQQALLFLIAAPRGSAAYHALPRVPGAAFAEVAEEGEQGGYRVFVTARRVTVALLGGMRDDVSSCLSFEAKPFVSRNMRQLFDSWPASFHRVESQGVAALLEAKALEEPACTQRGAALLVARADGLESAAALAPPALPLHRDVARFSRLLLLEECAMEEDICRHDMFNVRLRFAAFRRDHASPIVRYRLVAATAGDGAAEGGPRVEAVPPLHVYRGPAVGLLQPEGLRSRNAVPPEMHALGVLDVPGLPEGRPALVIGDTVYIRPASSCATEFAAVVASLESSTCFLVLPEGFFSSEVAAAIASGYATGSLDCASFDGLVHVRFSFDRRPLRHMAAALQAVQHLPRGSGSLLLPSAAVELPSDAEAAMQPLAEEVSAAAAAIVERGSQMLNPEQRHAVAAVMLGAGRASPYALNGPPGTGKTLTLVECALQLLLRYPGARLLCCAPLNYSADLLCSALRAGGVGGEAMLRLNDPRRPAVTVKSDVLQYCMYSDAKRMFELPSPGALASRRVVVTTCSAAAMLGRIGPLAAPFFTHVLIDEAGQALLPEALIPLTLLRPGHVTPGAASADTGWGAVLCGDPQQLGPVVRSPVAVAAGLAGSLLERLMQTHSAAGAALMRAGRAPATSTLVRNYRSHRRLLDLPSKLFYGSALLAAADPDSVLPPRWGELYVEGAAAESSAAAPDVSGRPPRGAAEDGGAAEGAAGEEESGFDERSVANLLFFGTRGQQMREGAVPSFYNPIEAATVAELVEGLLASGAGVRPNDIGVMATYRRQVQAVRGLLRQRKLGAIRVGTVDDYQGQEERIIFITTVLSKPQSLPPQQAERAAERSARGAGESHTQHIWRNPKRFNVAITRAKALLVVVGHPLVLLEDASWRELLRYCFTQGAYRGAGADAIRQRFRFDASSASSALPLHLTAENADGGAAEEREMQAAIARLAELALLGAGDVDRMWPETLDEMHAAYAEETQWRIML